MIKNNILIPVSIMILVILSGTYYFYLHKPSQRPISDTVMVSGIQLFSQTWGGNVEITGNVIFPFWTTLTIQPGTKVLFKKGLDIPNTPWTNNADAYIKDHNDPTGHTGYEATHFGITAVIKALGTKKSPIIFTSAQVYPEYADWDQLTLLGGSRLQFVDLSYAHNGITVQGNNVSITNSKIHDSLWSCIDIFSVGNNVADNEVYHCWHQAIGLKVKGVNTIQNNYVHDAELSINCENGANPNIISNHFRAAPFDQTTCSQINNNQIETGRPDVSGGTYNGVLIYPTSE